MLQFAADVSGDEQTGNHKFMALIIATDAFVASTIKRLGTNNIHMNIIQNKQRKDFILSTIKFDGKEGIAFCVRLDRDIILAEIKNKNPKRNISRSRIMYNFNYTLMNQMREQIDSFLIKHGHELSDIILQCDSDCQDFAKNNGLCYTDQGDAHTLADIVAWANNRNKEPEGVIPLDLREEITTKMKKRFK